MNLDESFVKSEVKAWLESQGYTVKTEVPVPLQNRDVILDLQGEKNLDRIWVEAKGDNGISDYLEGFSRLLFAVYYGGGRGIIAVGDQERLLEYEEFLKHLSEGMPVGIWTGKEVKWFKK